MKPFGDLFSELSENKYPSTEAIEEAISALYDLYVYIANG